MSKTARSTFSVQMTFSSPLAGTPIAGVTAAMKRAGLSGQASSRVTQRWSLRKS